MSPNNGSCALYSELLKNGGSRFIIAPNHCRQLFHPLRNNLTLCVKMNDYFTLTP